MKNILWVLFISPCLLFGQKNDFINLKNQKQDCIVIPERIYSDVIKYTGECKNGLANGLGTVTLSNGDKITGKFSNNLIMDGIVNYYYAESKAHSIGPFRNGKLDGRHINIGEYVTVSNFIKGSYVGNSNDYFNIPEVQEISSSNFPFYIKKNDPKYPFLDCFGEIISIPHSTLALVETLSDENSKGYRTMFFSLYDYKTNQVLRKIGDQTAKTEGFLSFGEDFMTIYIIQTKLNVKGVYKVNLYDGAVKFVCKYDQQKIVDFNKFKKKNNFYKNDKNNEEGYLQWGDFDILTKKIYVFNNYGRYDMGTSYTTFSIYSSDGSLINNLKIDKSQITAYAVHEGINQLALGYRTKDSVHLALYSLDSLKFLKVIDTRKDLREFESLKFSPFGKYLCAFKNMGTVIYMDDEIYYGVPGDVIFNNFENFVLCKEQNGIIAYDIENRKTLWIYKYNFEQTMYKPKSFKNSLKIDNDILLVFGGEGTYKPTINKLNFQLPFNSEMFYSLNMDVQRQLEAIKNPIKAEKALSFQKAIQDSNPAKKTTPSSPTNSDMMSTILSLYQKQALSNKSASKGSSGILDIDIGDNKNANSFQCRVCGKLSMSRKKPSDGAMSGCIKGSFHSWGGANTIHGLQCRYCGIKSYIINYDGTLYKDLPYSFGGGCEKKNYSHSWNEF